MLYDVTSWFQSRQFPFRHLLGHAQLESNQYQKAFSWDTDSLKIWTWTDLWRSIFHGKWKWGWIWFPLCVSSVWHHENEASRALEQNFLQERLCPLAQRISVTPGLKYRRTKGTAWSALRESQETAGPKRWARKATKRLGKSQASWRVARTTAKRLE